MAKEWVDSFLITRDYTCDLVSVEGVCVSVVMIVTPTQRQNRGAVATGSRERDHSTGDQLELYTLLE